eukprot:s2102_g9.t1
MPLTRPSSNPSSPKTAAGCSTSFHLLRLRSSDGQQVFQLALYEGVDSASLHRTVAARVGAPEDAIFCTSTPEATGPVVPLSAALLHAGLPEDFFLTVHVYEKPNNSFPGNSFQSDEPPKAAGAPPEGRSLEVVQSANSASYTSLLRMSRVRWENFAQQTDEIVTAMERFNRLSTDLANERTLLAWIRTAMAGIRTIFVFYAIEGVSRFWEAGVSISEVLMALLVLILLFTGRARYYAIKDLILKRDPPASFGRVSLRYTRESRTGLEPVAAKVHGLGHDNHDHNGGSMHAEMGQRVTCKKMVVGLKDWKKYDLMLSALPLAQARALLVAAFTVTLSKVLPKQGRTWRPKRTIVKALSALRGFGPYTTSVCWQYYRLAVRYPADADLTFAACGPGSRSGLNSLFGHPPDLCKEARGPSINTSSPHAWSFFSLFSPLRFPEKLTFRLRGHSLHQE